MYRRYGSNLSTSLGYILPWAKGCSPRKPVADSGTVSHFIRGITGLVDAADVSKADSSKANPSHLAFGQLGLPIQGPLDASHAESTDERSPGCEEEKTAFH